MSRADNNQAADIIRSTCRDLELPIEPELAVRILTVQQQFQFDDNRERAMRSMELVVTSYVDEQRSGDS